MGTIRIRKGIVKEIVSRNDDIVSVIVEYDGKHQKAISYCHLSGQVEMGDVVYVNTNANHLKLGSGGNDFIIVNETRGGNLDINNDGHIIKLRYTPYQLKCKCISEHTSQYQEAVNSFRSLGNMVVITGELHSMLSPTACCLKYLNDETRIAYIMTDGGSLPMAFSDSVRELKAKGIIAGTITSGNAFGGDVEAINIYEALIGAKVALNCNIAIVTMGPGIAGTGTKYGFSGIEQGHIIDCINTLEGISVVIPRISFSDPRQRHYGISHHTLTVLSEISKSRAYVVFPLLEKGMMRIIQAQIKKHGIDNKHIIKFVDCDTLYSALEFYRVMPSTMGRNIYEDLEFFQTCSSAAFFAQSIQGKGLSMPDS